MTPNLRFARVLLVAWAAPALLAGGVRAQESPPSALSLEDAVSLALRNNPTFLATRNDAEVADWNVRAAYGSLIPSLSASSAVSWQGSGEQRFGSITTEQLGFADQPSFYFSSYNVGLNYTVNGATLLAPGRAKANRRATGARIRNGEAELEAAVTRAYLEVLRQDEALHLANQELERARSNLRLARGQAEVGSATVLDVRRAEVEVGRARVGVLRAENAVHTARLALFRQIGVDTGDDVELTTEFDIREPKWSEEELYRTALERNPALAELEASRRAADVEVRSARTAYLPSLSVQAGYSGFTQEASNPSYYVNLARQSALQQKNQCQALNEIFRRLQDPLPTQDCARFELSDGQVQEIRAENSAFPFDFTNQPPQASLSLSIPVFQGLGRQREVEAARAQREDLRYRIRDQELALRADIGSGLAAVRTAYESARIEAQNQEVAAEQLRLAREQYQVGTISFVELVDAETVKAQADRERIAAVYSYHDAITNLEALVGTSLAATDEDAP